MPAVLLSLKRIWKKALLLFAVGTMISVLFMVLSEKSASTFLPDLFFTVGSVFLIVGLWGWIKNLGMFNSMKYGVKSLIRMFRGTKKPEPQDKMAGGYLEYINSRPKDQDVPWMLLLAFIFLLLSVLASLPLL